MPYKSDAQRKAVHANKRITLRNANNHSLEITNSFRKLHPDKFDKFNGVHAYNPFVGHGKIFDGVGNEFKIPKDVIDDVNRGKK